METLYYNENMDINALADCISRLFKPDKKTFMILEKVDEFCFSFIDNNSLWQKWEKGRIFNQHGELKWRKFPNRIHAVYMGEGDPGSGLNKETHINLHEMDPVDEEIFLWGKKVRKDDMKYFTEFENRVIYIEQQIPFIFEYPVENHRDRVKIKLKKYMDPSSGRMEFFRYLDLVEVKDS